MSGEEHLSDQGGSNYTGWRSALSADLRENEFIKGFEKPNDFARAALDLKTEHDSLKERMSGAIFKPGENATDEEQKAFYSALGVPESADGYEFTPGEGVTHDEAMVNWAKSTFAEAKLSGDQAKVITAAWDSFMQQLEAAHDESVQQGVKTADEALKKEWGPDYEKNIKVTERGYQAFEKAAPGFAELLEMDTKAGIKIGNDPRMLKAFHVIGNAIGDDLSLPATNPGQMPDGNTKGFQGLYNKSPKPPVRD